MKNELLKFSGLNITSQRLGGISLENSYSKLLGGSLVRLPPERNTTLFMPLKLLTLMIPV